MPTAPLDEPLQLMAQVAALCSDLGAHEQAISVFQHLALLRDQHPNSLVSLALALSRAGEEAAAQQTLRQALQRDPLHDMARVMLAIHLHQAGDAAARGLLQSFFDQRSPEPDADALALANTVKDEVLPQRPQPLPATAAQPPSALRSTHLRYSRA